MVLPLPLKALLDGKAADVTLQDHDELVVYESGEKAILPLAMVEGPVKHPASYQITKGMKIADLLFAAGGMSQEASNTVAHLYRRTRGWKRAHSPRDPGTSRRGRPRAEHRTAGQRPAGAVPAGRGGSAARQGEYRRGKCARPGEYRVYQGLTLYDLLIMAGGPTEESFRHAGTRPSDGG